MYPLALTLYLLLTPTIANLIAIPMNFFILDISYKRNQIIYVVFWLILKIMFPRFTYVVISIGTFFLYIAEQYSIVWIHHNFFTNAAIDRYLGGFHFGVIMSNAVINIHVDIIAWDCIFITLQYIPRMRLLDHMVIIFLNFGANARLFS